MLGLGALWRARFLLAIVLVARAALGNADAITPEDLQFDTACVRQFLNPIAFSCAGASKRGALPVGVGDDSAALFGLPTRSLLGAVFQFCSPVSLTRPATFILPPLAAAEVLPAVALALASQFKKFPQHIKNDFSRMRSLDEWQDALLRSTSSTDGGGGAAGSEAEGVKAGGGANGSSSAAAPPPAIVPRVDTLMFPYSAMQDLMSRKLLSNLGAIASIDALYLRRDVHTTLLNTVTYGDQFVGVPLDGSQLVLFARSDVFAAAGLSYPDSWQQLLQVAQQLNGTEASVLVAGPPAANSTRPTYTPSRGAVYGFCMPPSQQLLTHLVLAVLAPMVQTKGQQQGMYLDVDTLRPAVTTAAMPYVLSYLRRLAAYSAPVALSNRAYSNDFALGRCAMTVGTAAQFRRNSNAVHPAGPSAVRGGVAAVLLPGSEVVLSAEGKLVGCTAVLCPFGRASTVVSAPAPLSTAPVGTQQQASPLSGRRSLLLSSPSSRSSSPSLSSYVEAATSSVIRRSLLPLAEPAPGVARLVTRAPLLSPDGLAAGIDGSVETIAQLYSWSLLSSLGGTSISWQMLLLPSSEVGPWRLSHMDPASLPKWQAAGYHPGDTSYFLAAARDTLDHVNVVKPLRTRTAVQHNRAVRAAAESAAILAAAGVQESDADSTAAVQAATSKLTSEIGVLYGSTGPYGSSFANQLANEYHVSLGLRITAPLNPSSQGDGGKKVQGGSIVGIAMGASLAAAVALAVLGFVYCRRRVHHGRQGAVDEWLVVSAPEASPATCIAVTDIEGSTSLWEALPEAVMDVALRTHHRIVRAMSVRYGGYESATEGDSFILAFASAMDAAHFATALQQALLTEATWPAQLLAAPPCRPIFMQRSEELERTFDVALIAPAPVRQPLLLGPLGGGRAASVTAAGRRGGFGGTGVAAGVYGRQYTWEGHAAAVMELAGNMPPPPKPPKAPVLPILQQQDQGLLQEPSQNGAHAPLAVVKKHHFAHVAKAIMARLSTAGKSRPDGQVSHRASYTTAMTEPHQQQVLSSDAAPQPKSRRSSFATSRASSKYADALTTGAPAGASSWFVGASESNVRWLRRVGAGQQATAEPAVEPAQRLQDSDNAAAVDPSQQPPGASPAPASVSGRLPPTVKPPAALNWLWGGRTNSTAARSDLRVSLDIARNNAEPAAAVEGPLMGAADVPLPGRDKNMNRSVSRMASRLRSGGVACTHSAAQVPTFGFDLPTVATSHASGLWGGVDLPSPLMAPVYGGRLGAQEMELEEEAQAHASGSLPLAKMMMAARQSMMRVTDLVGVSVSGAVPRHVQVTNLSSSALAALPIQQSEHTGQPDKARRTSGPADLTTSAAVYGVSTETSNCLLQLQCDATVNGVESAVRSPTMNVVTRGASASWGGGGGSVDSGSGGGISAPQLALSGATDATLSHGRSPLGQLPMHGNANGAPSPRDRTWVQTSCELVTGAGGTSSGSHIFDDTIHLPPPPPSQPQLLLLTQLSGVSERSSVQRSNSNVGFGARRPTAVLLSTIIDSEERHSGTTGQLNLRQVARAQWQQQPQPTQGPQRSQQWNAAGAQPSSFAMLNHLPRTSEGLPFSAITNGSNDPPGLPGRTSASPATAARSSLHERFVKLAAETAVPVLSPASLSGNSVLGKVAGLLRGIPTFSSQAARASNTTDARGADSGGGGKVRTSWTNVFLQAPPTEPKMADGGDSTGGCLQPPGQTHGSTVGKAGPGAFSSLPALGSYESQEGCPHNQNPVGAHRQQAAGGDRTDAINATAGTATSAVNATHTTAHSACISAANAVTARASAEEASAAGLSHAPPSTAADSCAPGSNRGRDASNGNVTVSLFRMLTGPRIVGPRGPAPMVPLGPPPRAHGVAAASAAQPRHVSSNALAVFSSRMVSDSSGVTTAPSPLGLATVAAGSSRELAGSSLRPPTPRTLLDSIMTASTGAFGAPVSQEIASAGDGVASLAFALAMPGSAATAPMPSKAGGGPVDSLAESGLVKVGPTVQPPPPGSLLWFLHQLYTVATAGTQQQKQEQQSQSDLLLVFAGLHVRVGLHCGITDPRDIQYNAATARMSFGGEGLRIAKAVCDCASGGQVVMSGEVLFQMQVMSVVQPHGLLLMDLGDHQLFEAPATAPLPVPIPGAFNRQRSVLLPESDVGASSTLGCQAVQAVPVSRHLLQITSPALLGRLPLMPPVRSAIHQYTPGFMNAPVGDAVSVVVFRASNAASLLAWSAASAVESMALLELYLRASLGPLLANPLSGDPEGPTEGTADPPLACYLAAAPPGSPFGTFVAGFSQPAAAARWALTAAGRMAELPWPAELLDSPWGRAVEGITRAEAEAADVHYAGRRGVTGSGGGNALRSSAHTASSNSPPGSFRRPRMGSIKARKSSAESSCVPLATLSVDGPPHGITADGKAGGRGASCGNARGTSMGSARGASSGNTRGPSTKGNRGASMGSSGRFLTAEGTGSAAAAATPPLTEHGLTVIGACDFGGPELGSLLGEHPTLQLMTASIRETPADGLGFGGGEAGLSSYRPELLPIPDLPTLPACSSGLGRGIEQTSSSMAFMAHRSQQSLSVTLAAVGESKASAPGAAGGIMPLAFNNSSTAVGGPMGPSSGQAPFTADTHAMSLMSGDAHIQEGSPSARAILPPRGSIRRPDRKSGRVEPVDLLNSGGGPSSGGLTFELNSSNLPDPATYSETGDQSFNMAGTRSNAGPGALNAGSMGPAGASSSTTASGAIGPGPGESPAQRPKTGQPAHASASRSRVALGGHSMLRSTWDEPPASPPARSAVSASASASRGINEGGLMRHVGTSLKQGAILAITNSLSIMGQRLHPGTQKQVTAASSAAVSPQRSERSVSAINSGPRGGGLRRLGTSESPAFRMRPTSKGSATMMTAAVAEAAAVAAAARAEEDAELVSLRGLRVRLGMAVGGVRVELCPLTGRVVYSGKTVTAAMTAAAAARLGTLYVSAGAAKAIQQGEVTAAGKAAGPEPSASSATSAAQQGSQDVGAIKEDDSSSSSKAEAATGPRVLVCTPAPPLAYVGSTGLPSSTAVVNATNVPFRCRFVGSEDKVPVPVPALCDSSGGT